MGGDSMGVGVCWVQRKGEDGGGAGAYDEFNLISSVWQPLSFSSKRVEG